jgi:site-specific DNA recombinase
MQVAIYTRVSTERQEREQTIESQLAVLRAWVEAHGHTVRDEHIYQDQGYSGARLDRPGLDRLRDTVQDGDIRAVVVLSPDRLARKYVYQVLLLEEFKRAGCQTLFVHRPIGEDPSDQLLLQIQGAIAEYERALLGERFRRGKLQKARAGQYLSSRAPYGYRYVPKRESAPGHLVIDDAEADLVRMMYRWLIEERMTIRQILKRLSFGPHQPRCGRLPWSASTVHHILADPIYAGTAYSNRYRYVPPKRPRRTRGPHTAEASCRQPRPREEWIPIGVPAILDEATAQRAQEQLGRNALLSFRRNSHYNYLLRCLVSCGACGLAMFGRTYGATKTQPPRQYYSCHGKDCIVRARDRACSRRPVRAPELESAVWMHVRGLLEDPARLFAQFEAFGQAALQGDEHDQAEQHHVARRLDRLAREERRLVDAYQVEVISLGELAERRRHLEQRRRALIEQQEQAAQLRRERFHAQEVLASLTAFCERVGSRLAEATFEEKQVLLNLLVERIIVQEHTLEVHHVIPLGHGPPPHRTAQSEPLRRLSPDGVHSAALPAGALQHRAYRRVQPGMGAAGHQLQLSCHTPDTIRPVDAAGLSHAPPAAKRPMLDHDHRRRKLRGQVGEQALERDETSPRAPDRDELVRHQQTFR